MFRNDVHNDSDFTTPNVSCELTHKILRMEPVCGLSNFLSRLPKKESPSPSRIPTPGHKVKSRVITRSEA